MQASAEHFDLQHGITNNLDGLTCSNFLPLLAACGKIHRFLRLLAVRLSTSCVSKVLAGKPQKHDIFTSCGGLCVVTAQEALAVLLARTLFLGCTVNRGSFFLFYFFFITNTILTIQYQTSLTLLTMLIYITLVTVTNNYTTYNIQLY